MKYLTKNYLDKGDFTKAQEVIENLKSEIKSIIKKKEESQNAIKNNNINLKNNNYNIEKQKIIGGDKLAEILEILKNVPRVAKLRISDPLLIKTAYGYKLLKERSKKTREALKKAKRGEIFVYDDHIDPELKKIKKYVYDIEKTLEEQTSIIEDEETNLDDTEIEKNKELYKLIDLILKYYKNQFDSLFPKEKKEDVKKLIDYIEYDLIKLFKMDEIWKIFLLMHNLMLYEECVQIDLDNREKFNFYLKRSDLFKENKKFQDRRISTLVYQNKKDKKYYAIVGFHLFPLNDNFNFKKNYIKNLENLEKIKNNQFEEINLDKNYRNIKTIDLEKYIRYLKKQKNLLELNYFTKSENIISFRNIIKDEINIMENDNLIEKIDNFDFEDDTDKKEKLKADIKENIKVLKEIRTKNQIYTEEGLKNEIIIDLNNFILIHNNLLKALNSKKNKQNADEIIDDLTNDRDNLKKNFYEFKNKVDKIQEQSQKALELIIEIDKIFMNNYSHIKIITPNDFENLQPIMFKDIKYDLIKEITKEDEELKDYLKIDYIQNKTKDQVDIYKKYNDDITHNKGKCKDLFNIDFDERTKNIKYQNFKIDLEDLEIKKLTDIQKNIKKHTDDIIELYQNIDTLGKEPVKDIDDMDIKFSTNLLKQYVDKQILKGEKIKDIRRNFYRKIKRITQNDNDKYYLNKLEEIIAEEDDLKKK